MLVTSHGAFAWRLTRRPLLTLGAVAPDLPALAFALTDLATGTPRDKVLHRAYRLPNRRLTHLTAHGLASPAAVALLGARQIAAGWLSHLLVDYATHHTDAWPPLWPWWNRRWRSPVSYWQPEHHGRAFQVTESAALALLVLRAPSRADRAVAAVALVFAALPLTHDNAHGLPGFKGLKPRGRPPVAVPPSA